MQEVKELSRADINDLASNPTKYGLPTFEEFAKNPEKYRNQVTADELLSQIDKGSQHLNRHVVSQDYYVSGYRCASLEKAEQMLQDMGLSITKVKMLPEVIDLGAGKCKISVTFKLPDE